MLSLILALLIAGVPTARATLAAPVATSPAPSAVPALASTVNEHKIYGFVQSLHGNTLTITNRSGKTVVVDGSFAHSTVHFYRGRPVIVFGAVDGAGIVHANAVWRTFPDAAHWPADR